ncbi:abortive infection family protein [Streptomyces xanthophaeus]|uniref:abortive infection family protein n=1 Tax=Streptomyces xanthophaeus TaxID=67385 RepID=UPI00371A2722
MKEPLPEPRHVQAGHWAAISDGYERLGRAVEAGDFAHVVGSAKELTESVARITIDANGQVYSADAPYPTLLSTAHGIVAHTSGLPANDLLRAIPDGARKMAVQLAELRNRYGTGHGRAGVPAVTEEVAEACVHAALVWIRWVLARHNEVFLGNVNQLLADLASASFRSGALAERLAAANLPGLAESEQRQLGLAVGRRTAGGTWTVCRDGVSACSTDPERWPAAYRTGVITGLFTNWDNQIEASAAYMDCPVTVLQHHSAAEDALTELLTLIRTTPWSHRFRGRYKDVVQAIQKEAPRVPGHARPHWDAIADTLAAQAPTRTA